jgi:hypothetical protein
MRWGQGSRCSSRGQWTVSRNATGGARADRRKGIGEVGGLRGEVVPTGRVAAVIVPEAGPIAPAASRRASRGFLESLLGQHLALEPSREPREILR